MQKLKILWGLLFFLTGVVFFDGLSLLLKKESLLITEYLKFSLPVLIMFLYAFWTLPYIRAFFFIMLALGVGLIAELIGLHFETVFGGQYFYPDNLFGFSILGLPLLIPLFWSVFIYTGYALTNCLLLVYQKAKPRFSKQDWRRLIVLVLLDGWNVMAIDLVMDPLFVKEGKWIWQNQGNYFGVPWGNFLGWFLITILVTALFRWFEYKREERKKTFDQRMLLVPVLAYVLLYFSFVFLAFYLDLFVVVLIGIFVMLPLPLWIFGRYRKFKKINE